MKCFFCSNQINPHHQTYIQAQTTAHYKRGGQRFATRNFHLSCFEKFEDLGGRPFNPFTDYTVDAAWEEHPDGSSERVRGAA
jgi:hypothetical protein